MPWPKLSAQFGARGREALGAMRPFPLRCRPRSGLSSGSARLLSVKANRFRMDLVGQARWVVHRSEPGNCVAPPNRFFGCKDLIRGERPTFEVVGHNVGAVSRAVG